MFLCIYIKHVSCSSVTLNDLDTARVECEISASPEDISHSVMKVNTASLFCRI